MTRLPPLMAAMVISLAAVLTASAAEPVAGRFTMNPAEGGMLRLDTLTGAVALCSRKNEQWACEPIKDGAKASEAEIERLAAENKQLKADVQRLEEFALSNGNKTPETPSERPGGALALPSEADVDRAFDYVERMFKKFRDRIKDLDGSERRGISL